MDNRKSEVDMESTPITRSFRAHAFDGRRAIVIFVAAFTFGMIQSCWAMTRVESVPIGIPGSGGALGTSVALHDDTAARVMG